MGEKVLAALGSVTFHIHKLNPSLADLKLRVAKHCSEYRDPPEIFPDTEACPLEPL